MRSMAEEQASESVNVMVRAAQDHRDRAGRVLADLSTKLGDSKKWLNPAYLKAAHEYERLNDLVESYVPREQDTGPRGAGGQGGSTMQRAQAGFQGPKIPPVQVTPPWREGFPKREFPTPLSYRGAESHLNLFRRKGLL